jgi:hypothetical protein
MTLSPGAAPVVPPEKPIHKIGIVQVLDTVAKSQGRISSSDKALCEVFAKELLRAKTYYQNGNAEGLREFFLGYC